MAPCKNVAGDKLLNKNAWKIKINAEVLRFFRNDRLPVWSQWRCPYPMSAGAL
jgi:hypothetical protein